MPDAFFLSKKTRKRKRGPALKDPSSSKKAVNGKGRPNGKARVADEDIDSGGSQDEEGIDDMDLRASDGENYVSAEEDELETPAEKRLRLANLYLESVKEKLGKATTVFLRAQSLMINMKPQQMETLMLQKWIGSL